MRHSSEFIHNAFIPFGYPKRAFNNFPLRDHLNSMVIDGVGKWNGHILVYKFSWKSEQIKYLLKVQTRVQNTFERLDPQITT